MSTPHHPPHKFSIWPPSCNVLAGKMHDNWSLSGFLFVFFFFFFYNCTVPFGLFPWEIRVARLGESQLPQSRATQPTVHTECFSVSIIHRTLTWTTGSLTCLQMLMHAICTRGCTDTVRESALKVDSGKNIPRGTGEWNPRQWRDGPMLNQLSYIPTHLLPTSDWPKTTSVFFLQYTLDSRRSYCAWSF